MNEDKASRYHRLRRRSIVVSAAMWAVALVLLLPGGFSVALRDAAVAMTGAGVSAPITVGVYAVALALAYEACALPVAFYQSFVLDRRYGLSSEPVRAWLRDHVKAAALVTALGTGAAEIVYLALRSSPRWWWVLSALAFAIAIIAIARVAPTLLLPLFYKFRPLERERLSERLLSLSTRARVPVLGVFEWGLGEKTSRANAALVGTGGSRRILLSDTLLSDYSDEEIEVILAHELGHHVHRDIPSALFIEVALLTVSLAFAAAALSRFWQPLGLVGPFDVAGLPIVLAAATVVSLTAQPLLNALSRRNERRADAFALRLTGRTAAFVSAMRRLAVQNLAEERPSRTVLWLFHTHPPLEQRLEAARQFELQQSN